MMGPVCLIWDATENKEVNGTVICQNSSMLLFLLLKRKLHIWVTRVLLSGLTDVTHFVLWDEAQML